MNITKEEAAKLFHFFNTLTNVPAEIAEIIAAFKPEEVEADAASTESSAEASEEASEEVTS